MGVKTSLFCDHACMHAGGGSRDGQCIQLTLAKHVVYNHSTGTGPRNFTKDVAVATLYTQCCILCNS